MASLLLDESARAPANADDPRRAEAGRLLAVVAGTSPALRGLSAEPALALAELGRLALQAGDGTGALQRLDAAQAAFDAVTGLKDVRGQAFIGRLRAQALDATRQRMAPTFTAR